MANEAVIIELLGKDPGCPIQYTCAEGTTIAKGTLLELSAARTVIANTNAAKGFVGIAAAEKVAGDGSTTITAWTNGIFDLKSDAGVDNRGASLMLSATENIIQSGDAGGLLDGSEVGNYLEAGTANGVEAVRILK